MTKSPAPLKKQEVNYPNMIRTLYVQEVSAMLYSELLYIELKYSKFNEL